MTNHFHENFHELVTPGVYGNATTGEIVDTRPPWEQARSPLGTMPTPTSPPLNFPIQRETTMTGIPGFTTNQLIPGFQNADPLPADVAKRVIGASVPGYGTDQRITAAVDSYVANIQQTEGPLAITANRAAEITGLARQFAGGNPEQIARKNLIDRGLAVDFDRFPKGFRETLQATGTTDDEVIDLARSTNPGVSQKEALERYYDTVKRRFADDEKFQKGQWYTDPVYTAKPSTPQQQPDTNARIADALEALAKKSS